MEHVFAPGVAILPELGVGIEPGSETVVCRADDPVVKIEGDRTHFAERVLRAEAGDMSQSHGVFRDADTGAVGHRVDGEVWT